jgi:hypothetical protein
MCPPDGRNVVWTTRAENRLDAFCYRLDGAGSGLQELLAETSARVAAVFPDARTVIVLDQYVGFRARCGEAVLLVDVRPAPGTRIVKLGSAERLDREHHAWQFVPPRGFNGNGVFMSMVPVAGPAGGTQALVYQDAHSHIGLADTRLLEDAFVDGVRFGAPTAESVADVLGDLFAALGQTLYHRSGCGPLSAAGVELNPEGPGRPYYILEPRLAEWQVNQPGFVRREVNTAFPHTAEGFIDPVDFFAYVGDEVRAGRPAAWLPRVRRGCAHGDLHGRNVLVGVEHNRATRPALFDYEHMSRENLVGWDFVKLETELKIRAYPRVFENLSVRAFADSVRQFEVRLGEQTEAHRRSQRWPAVGGGDPGERLFGLLLALRRLAGEHLGQGRWQEWLHEYYFLLAAYGVHTVRFATPTPHEQAAAFVSAGVAASRYVWPRAARGVP